MNTAKIREFYKDKFGHGDVLLEWMDEDYTITISEGEWVDYKTIYKDDECQVWFCVEGKRLQIRYSDKED